MKSKNKINKILNYALTFVLIVLCSAGFATFGKVKSVLAFNESMTVSNSWNITKDTKISSFTAGDYASDVEGKILDLSKAEDLPNSKRTAPFDDYVLMIDGRDGSSRYSYTTNSSTTLTSNGCYVISVDVFTLNAGANLYLLKGEETFERASLVSNKKWTTQYFFIKTNDIEDISLKLKMELNNGGVALFDNISVKQLSEQKYDEDRVTYSANSTEIDLRTNVIQELFNDRNASREDLKFTKTDYEFNVASTAITKVYSGDGKTNEAIKFYNNEKTYSTYELNNEFTFEQNKVYKLTVYAKADTTGSPSLSLKQTNLEDEETAVDSKTVSISSSKSENVTNDFKAYSFYIVGNPIKDKTYKLNVNMGTSSSKVSGSLYISRVSVSNITYKTFSTASDSNKLDLSSSFKLSDNANYVNNGTFNTMEVTSIENLYPAKAVDWTISANDSSKYGIVNTNSSEFAKINSLDYSALVNPRDTRGGDTSNNVLMMYAKNDTIVANSASKTLNAKGYASYSLDINTQNGTAKVSLVTTVNSKELTLASIDVNTNYSWENVELNLHNAYQELKVNVKIELTSSNYAYCYVDNVKYTSSITETYFTNLVEDEFKTKSDLTEIFSSNETNDFALPLYFEGNGTAMHAGIVNINSNIIDNAKFKDTNNENVLGIHMIDEGYYTFTSKLGYTLSTSKYYQISMKVYTEPLIDQNNSKGVSLKLSSFDDTFTNIVSNGKWTTYTFYVNPDKDTTTNLVFSLGDENNLTSGYAFLSDIEIKDDLTKEQYSEIKSSQNVRVLSKVIANENESETETKTSKSKTNWWMIISSMVFPIVIIVAIVVILLRKVKWKKFAKKKTKTDYDRKETVNVQVASRRATMIREENIRKTKAELNELTAEHVKYEEEYKQNLLELRKLKIKRGDALEIKNLEKNCKKIQKTSASLGMNINKLKSKLDYMQTDAYYNNLVKQISSNKFVDENK